MANVKEFYQGIDGSVTIEYDDGSVTKGNPVIASSSDAGVEIQVGSDTRAIITAGMSGGVPTGNFM